MMDGDVTGEVMGVDDLSVDGEGSACDMFVAEEINDDGELVLRILDDGEDEGEVGEKNMPPEEHIELYPGMEFGSGVEFVAHVHRYGQSRGHGVWIRDSQKDTRAKVVAQVAADAKMSKLATWFNLENKYKHFVRIRMWCRKGGKFKSRCLDSNRSTTSCKCECPFMLIACRSPINGTVWRITTLLESHNHDLDPELSQYLPRYRRISIQDQVIAKELYKASVGVAKIYDIFVNKYESYDKVLFTETDLRNYVYYVNRKSLKDSDFGKMEIHFQKMREQSPEFFYEYDVDEADYTLKNVFWVDSRCRDAFQEFGDVVCFDTTFVTNRYKMPFAPFVGVNHHGKTMLFGCALIAKEDTKSFSWVFQTFKKCMGKEPVCILTDQDKAIGIAIRRVYPAIKHRWCIWHVMRNCWKHLGMQPAWGEISKKLQDMLHDSFTVDEFEGAWEAWVANYGVGSYSWVVEMYKERKRWAPVFFKQDFWAGMSSTQRSEGNNHYLKCFVDINTCLADFVEKYGKAVCRRIKEEDTCTAVGRDRSSRCTLNHPFEAVFEKMYTRDIFLEWHDDELTQFGLTTGTIVRGEVPIVEYDVLVKEFRVGWTKRANFRVIMDRSTAEVKCECLKFEFRGLICVHMLRVFWEEDYLYVPQRYILRRWSKNIPRKYMADSYPMQALQNGVDPEVNRYQEVKKVGEEIGVMVMSNEELHKDVMVRLCSIKNETKDRIGMHEGITSHVIGGVCKVYRSLGNCRPQDSRSEPELVGEGDAMVVKDHVDKRGTGRGQRKRKKSFLDQIAFGKSKGLGRGRGRKVVAGDRIGTLCETVRPTRTSTKDVGNLSRVWNVPNANNLVRHGFQITGGNGSIPLANKHLFGLF